MDEEAFHENTDGQDHQRKNSYANQNVMIQLEQKNRFVFSLYSLYEVKGYAIIIHLKGQKRNEGFEKWGEH